MTIESFHLELDKHQNFVPQKITCSLIRQISAQLKQG